MRDMRRKAVRLFLILPVLFVVVAGILLSVGARSGKRASGARPDRLRPRHSGMPISNAFPIAWGSIKRRFFEMGRKYFFGGSKARLPKAEIETIVADPALFKKPPGQVFVSHGLGTHRSSLSSMNSKCSSTLCGSTVHRHSLGPDQSCFLRAAIAVR